MRSLTPILWLSSSIFIAAPAMSQQIAPDIVAAADRAAEEAERSAAEAERASTAARQSAIAARAAANAVRMAAGDAPMPPAQAPSVQSPPATATVTAPLPANSVQGSAAAAAIPATVANGPNDSALKVGAGPDLELIASSKEKVASLAWTVDVSGQPRPGQMSADKLTVTASAKLDDSGDASFVGLGGLTAGNEVKLAYTHFQGRVRLGGSEESAVAEARRRCQAQPEASAAACNPYDYAEGVGSFVAKYYPEGLKPLVDEVMPGSVIFYGLSVSGTQSSFKYLDRTKFAIDKEDRLGFGAGIFGGLLFNYGQSAVIGSFDQKRSFKENDPVTLCGPVAGTDFIQCLTGADGAPKRKNQSIVGLELRHAFPAKIGSFSSLAISPKFSVDLANEIYGASVPVYFVGDGTGKLRGGVRAGYVNQEGKDGKREDDFTLGVFVGVPFSVFR